MVLANEDRPIHETAELRRLYRSTDAGKIFRAGDPISSSQLLEATSRFREGYQFDRLHASVPELSSLVFPAGRRCAIERCSRDRSAFGRLLRCSADYDHLGIATRTLFRQCFEDFVSPGGPSTSMTMEMRVPVGFRAVTRAAAAFARAAEIAAELTQRPGQDGQ
jgi:hypothetical protein